MNKLLFFPVCLCLMSMCLVFLSTSPFFQDFFEGHYVLSTVDTNPDHHLDRQHNSPINTAFILDGRFLPNRMSYVVRNAQQVLGPSWIIMISSSSDIIPKLRKVIAQDETINPSRVEYISFEQNITSASDYNNIVKNPSLWKRFKGDFVLFFQTDSVLCSKSPYKVEDFFAFDYIGGFTPEHERYLSRCKKIPNCYSNGGLSLRRISSAIKVFDLIPPAPFFPCNAGKQDNPEFWDEDMYLFEGISRLGVPMPDQNFSLAQHFAFSTWNGPSYVTFGGHKVTKGKDTKQFRAFCPEYAELEEIVDDDM